VPGSAEGQGSYCQTLVRCCEEVWRRMSSPAAFIFGLPRGLQRKGDASFNHWKVRATAGRAPLTIWLDFCWKRRLARRFSVHGRAARMPSVPWSYTSIDGPPL
jgi:hypothetical protein